MRVFQGCASNSDGWQSPIVELAKGRCLHRISQPPRAGTNALIARKIAEVPRAVVCGADSYIEPARTPANAEELVRPTFQSTGRSRTHTGRRRVAEKIATHARFRGVASPVRRRCPGGG